MKSVISSCFRNAQGFSLKWRKATWKAMSQAPRSVFDGRLIILIHFHVLFFSRLSDNARAAFAVRCHPNECIDSHLPYISPVSRYFENCASPGCETKKQGGYVDLGKWEVDSSNLGATTGDNNNALLARIAFTSRVHHLPRHSHGSAEKPSSCHDEGQECT